MLEPANIFFLSLIYTNAYLGYYEIIKTEYTDIL